MTTTEPLAEAARAEAEAVMSEARERVGITVREQTRYVEGYVAGAEWARIHLTTQEESILMTSREETISDRLSDAGYTEYAEDEDGGFTWVSAPLGEVLSIVSAALSTVADDLRAEGAREALTSLADAAAHTPGGVAFDLRTRQFRDEYYPAPYKGGER